MESLPWVPTLVTPRSWKPVLTPPMCSGARWVLWSCQVLGIYVCVVCSTNVYETPALKVEEVAVEAKQMNRQKSPILIATTKLRGRHNIFKGEGRALLFTVISMLTVHEVMIIDSTYYWKKSNTLKQMWKHLKVLRCFMIQKGKICYMEVTQCIVRKKQKQKNPPSPSFNLKPRNLPVTVKYPAFSPYTNDVITISCLKIYFLLFL